MKIKIIQAVKALPSPLNDLKKVLTAINVTPGDVLEVVQKTDKHYIVKKDGNLYEVLITAAEIYDAALDVINEIPVVKNKLERLWNALKTGLSQAWEAIKGIGKK